MRASSCVALVLLLFGTHPTILPADELDLLAEARGASWTNDRGDPIEFGAETGEAGSVKYENRDLFIHPRWAARGQTLGTFGPFRLPPETWSVLRLSGGLKSGAAGSDGVAVTIRLHVWKQDQNHSQQGDLGEGALTAETPGDVRQKEIDLSRYQGFNLKIQLIADARGHSAQDWLLLRELRLVSGGFIEKRRGPGIRMDQQPQGPVLQPEAGRIDLIAHAASARWRNGSAQNLYFGNDGEEVGSAMLLKGAALENDIILLRALGVHPQWMRLGSIEGAYHVSIPAPGAFLVMEGGFLRGARESDGVVFRAMFLEDGSDFLTPCDGFSATYDGRLDQGVCDLTPAAGKTGDLVLTVLAGETADQDQAAWAKALLISRSEQELDSPYPDVRCRLLDRPAAEAASGDAEKLLVLIDERLYGSLARSIDRYLVDLLQERMDVWACVLDPTPLRGPDGRWKSNAGVRLRHIVRDLYRAARMDAMASRYQRGLVLVGAFPAMFLRWDQEDLQPAPVSWASLHATNDYRRSIFHLEWERHPQWVRWYELTMAVDRGEGWSPAGSLVRLHRIRSDFEVPLLRYLPDEEKGQGTFRFELCAILAKGRRDCAVSNEVNWNFLINPSDYLLADVDGFETLQPRAMEYTKNKDEPFGFAAEPAMVTTEGLASNRRGLELSPGDRSAGRDYAQAEMYVGRIDAFAIARGATLPDRIDDSRWPDEVEILKQYFDRNHRWRTDSSYRAGFDRALIFRSCDVPGPREEKEEVRAIWLRKLAADAVVLEDARMIEGCSDAGAEPGASPDWDCDRHLAALLGSGGRWRVADLAVHGAEDGFTLAEGATCLGRPRTWDDRAFSVRELSALPSDFKFLVNHGCTMGQFLAPNNASTSLLFKGSALAEWAWSGSGSGDHKVLHESLRDGDRFGVAWLKNADAVLERRRAWRFYFNVSLGDPTLRVFALRQPQ